MTTSKHTDDKPSNFIESIVEEDLKAGTHGGVVTTRFPPEPNGYLHIGHAKSICLNFGLARDYKGTCHLRFDDTNPEKEDVEYVASIQEDIRWLGFDWGENLYHASDYFEKLYEFAENLIKQGKAYICDLNEAQIREYRGTVKEPGKPSPFRDRSVEENLDLFRRMRAGEFEAGAHVLRAKIDMASSNMKMRDPLLYRIRHETHHRTGDAWCIYPMYDFAHCLSDAIENITHSICTLEFENNRELYNWILDETEGVPFRSRQYEFARLNLNYTIMSKRKLLELVKGGFVSGWDDPRMPTLSGMRRRGYTPEAIRDFCDRIGVAKANSVVDITQLEFSVRNDLNQKAPRVMCVLDPLKVVIDNYPEGKTEILDASLFPHDVPLEGSRDLPFSREVYIDREDFQENPPPGFRRLVPGGEVRLRHGYVIKCNDVEKDASGQILALRCTYDPETLGVNPEDRKIKGAVHWVSVEHGVPAKVRLYDRLFNHERPDGDKEVDFKTFLNPNSLTEVDAFVEPYIADHAPGTSYQFERTGFFCSDSKDSKEGALVFNRTAQLRDSWAKSTSKAAAPEKKIPQKSTRPAQPAQVARDVTEGLDDAQKAVYEQLKRDLGLGSEEAALLASDADIAAFFETARSAHDNPKAIANWIVNHLRHEIKDRSLADLGFGGEDLGALVSLIDDQTISTKIAKDVFEHMIREGGNPRDIVESKGLKQVTDSTELEGVIEQVLRDNPDETTRFRNGEKKLMGFFVGQAMKSTRGKGNPKLINQLLREKLG